MSARFFELPAPGTPAPDRIEFMARGLIAPRVNARRNPPGAVERYSWAEDDDRPRPPRWAAFAHTPGALRLDEKARASATIDVLDFIENGAWADREGEHAT